MGAAEFRSEFIRQATWHGSLDAAERLLAAHPELATLDIHTAAVLGDDDAVRRFIAADPASATAKSEPYGGDALVYLGLSKYLRLDGSRSDRFRRAAEALLDAGADPNSGFWSDDAYPEFETALYGAAGVAHDPELTRLLIERGADPNDDEAVYHSPETADNRAMAVLVETGRLTDDNLALMLVRKHDWHDYDGIKYLLERGASPNRTGARGWHPFHHAIARDNDLRIIELLLEHGADPAQPSDGRSGIARAARRGRDDVLEAIERRGWRIELDGVDALIVACARNDTRRARELATREPQLVAKLLAEGGTLLAEFAGTANTVGVGQLLDLGVPVAAAYAGDGYFDIAPESTALHVAAWKACHDTVRLLIARGAPIDAVDGKGRTPLMLAVKACVDSYWTSRRKPDSVEALLAAGASTDGVPYPCGYDEVDALLRAHATGR